MNDTEKMLALEGAADIARDLVDAIRSIAHGDEQMTGLEALAVAVADRGLDTPLGPAIRDSGDAIASALADVAEAIRESTNH